jgi:hypothetical protein
MPDFTNCRYCTVYCIANEKVGKYILVGEFLYVQKGKYFMHHCTVLTRRSYLRIRSNEFRKLIRNCSNAVHKKSNLHTVTVKLQYCSRAAWNMIDSDLVGGGFFATYR